MNDVMNEDQDTLLQAMVLRRLLAHLQSHPEIQNIDLMLTADFCRNCLAKWYVESAQQLGRTLDYERARDIVYGMPYAEWKARYQKDAPPEQRAAFAAKQAAKDQPLK